MSKAIFRRPDGRDGTYADWAAETAARWAALPADEKDASRTAAAARLAGQIRAADDGDEPTLMHLYDAIGWFGIWPADVVEALKGIKGDVEVHINSPGGNVFDGLAIYAALKQHSGKVGVVVDGLAASAASFIAMAASPGLLAMTPNGTMMIHEARAMCIGGAGDMRDTADVLDRTGDNIASIYAERGLRPVTEFRDLMKAETWAIGQEAVDLHLADTVRKPSAPPPDPDPAAGNGAAAAAPWQVTILAAPPAVTDGAADESAWDGPAAMSWASSQDNPQAAFRAICAGEKTTGDPGTQAHWALPHHKHSGDPPNRKGVSSALGYLPKTQDLKSESAARAHLEAHQRAMGESGSSDDRADLPAWIRDA